MRIVLVILIIIGVMVWFSKKDGAIGSDYNFNPDRQEPDDPQQRSEIYSDQQIENLSTLEVVARTLYGEGREGSFNEMKKIAMVIENRVKSYKYPSSYKDVCLQPMQFSCWNNWQTKDSNNYEVRRRFLSDQLSFDHAKQVARSLINGSLNNQFDSDVLHYFSKKYRYDPVIQDGKILSGAPYFAIGEQVADQTNYHVYVKGVK